MTSLDLLTHELSKLPGVGNKTALRLALFITRQPAQYALNLAKALTEVTSKIRFCSVCFHLTDQELCSICTNPMLDHKILCVVEESSDLMALEKTKIYRGRYHVLQGALSPLDGIGPDNLRVKELIQRLRSESVEEIILATSPNVTGDATALYVSKLIKPLGLRMTKLASGLPVGGDIQYADPVTLSRAF